MTDSAVQQTNADAAISKLSCVNAGYFDDDFLPLFVRTPLRRNPIINKGYNVRVQIMRRTISRVVEIFGKTDGGCQLVILGAGVDTNGLHALKSHPQKVTCFEIDFSDAMHHKSRVISSHISHFPFLAGSPSVQHSQEGDLLWSTPALKLIGHDLRSPTESLDHKLALVGFDKAKPTLFLAECVLIYMEAHESDCVIEWAARLAVNPTVPHLLAIYEQVNGRDAFGRMMVENLASRGCPLRSIGDSTEAMSNRFSRLGFKLNRFELVSHFDPLIEKQHPEIIDELEEYNLLQSHHAFGFGANDRPHIGEYMQCVFTSDDNVASS